MVLIRTESTRYTGNCSFGENINKFQDCNIKKSLGVSKKKKKKLLTRIPIYLPKPVKIYIYIYIYIYI